MISTTLTLNDSLCNNLIWFFGNPLPLVIFVGFILKKQEIWTFFADWRQVGDRIAVRPKSQLSDCNVKRLKYVIVSVNWFICGSAAIILCSSITKFDKISKSSNFLCYYKEIRDHLNLNFVTAFHTASLLLIYFLTSFSDVVPGFIFYHIGLNLQSLKKDLKRQFQRLNH